MPESGESLKQSSAAADDSFDNRTVDTSVQNCPADKTHWVTIELVDEAGNPVAAEPYQIEAGNGEIRRAETGTDGRATEQELADGNCQVSFPERARNAWHRLEAAENHYIEISLVDIKGKPAANESYLLELPDGTVREGALDGNGFAREEETGAGTGRVWFYNSEVEPL